MEDSVKPRNGYDSQRRDLLIWRRARSGLTERYRKKPKMVLIPRDASINMVKDVVADIDIIVGDFSLIFQ
jgi:hypothetical protein